MTSWMANGRVPVALSAGGARRICARVSWPTRVRARQRASRTGASPPDSAPPNPCSRVGFGRELTATLTSTPLPSSRVSDDRRGAEVAAICYTLLESAKLAGVGPHAYVLEATRRAIAAAGAVTLLKDLT